MCREEQNISRPLPLFFSIERKNVDALNDAPNLKMFIFETFLKNKMGCLKISYGEKKYTGLKVVYSALYENENSCTGAYRYGFGGHEKDDEIKGSGNHLSFNDYGYDPRTGRRFCLDPHAKDYPEISPYAAFGDNPIFFTDPDGRDIKPSITFKASSFNPILNNLLKNNSSFNTALGKYKNDPKFNITLDINNAKVPAGKAANTSYNFNYQTVNGKKVTTSIEANISFRTDAGDNTNDLGKTTLLLHEYFHAYAGLQAVGGNDTKHDIWDNYLGLMQKAVQEYSDDNKLGLDATQVKELSIFNAGPGANIYDNYIKGLADKNKTTVEQEQSAFNDRINTLTTPKKEEAPVEEK